MTKADQWLPQDGEVQEKRIIKGQREHLVMDIFTIVIVVIVSSIYIC